MVVACRVGCHSRASSSSGILMMHSPEWHNHRCPNCAACPHRLRRRLPPARCSRKHGGIGRAGSNKGDWVSWQLMKTGLMGSSLARLSLFIGMLLNASSIPWDWSAVSRSSARGRSPDPSASPASYHERWSARGKLRPVWVAEQAERQLEPFRLLSQPVVEQPRISSGELSVVGVLG